MLTKVLIWIEPKVHDMVVAMVMAPRVVPSYFGWWGAMCLGPLQLDELDSDDGSEVANQPLEEDD